MKTSSYEESFDESCQDDTSQDEQIVQLQYESYQTPQHESHEQVDTTVHDESDPVTVTTQEWEPIAETITPQREVYTVSAPPPVPKRTLLPADSSKTTKAPKHETPEPVSQYVTPTATVATTPQHEPSIKDADEQTMSYRDIEFSPEDSAPKAETRAERWSDSTSVSLPQVEDVETVSSDPGNAQCEPTSEMYYTASSEVSLLSDIDQDKVHDDEEKERDDRKKVIAGHVAAMRERFESMTRANTPCPDLARSLSPSLEVFRNMSPSPDRMA